LLLLCSLLGSADAAVTVAVEEEGAPIPVPACGWGLVGGGRGAAPGRVGEGGGRGHGGVVGGASASARGGGGSLHGWYAGADGEERRGKWGIESTEWLRSPFDF